VAMEQTKALNALEPYLALSKSATSARAAADLIERATSDPNTFIFAELLQTPQIQALETSDSPSHFTLLQIFSYGTFEAYHSTQNLPSLNDAQTLKLRQLTLLSLASDRTNLSYEVLQRALGLISTRDVESLVITAIYAGLLDATLDPARQTLQVTSVAPLRDLAPASVPDLIASLDNWSSRCSSTLTDLEAHIEKIKADATKRENDKKAAALKLKRQATDFKDDKKTDTVGGTREVLPRRGLNKRSMETGTPLPEDAMEIEAEAADKRTNKRKM
ncbi:hypothetical protein Golomagni_07686, partial [Golovinomyces magnicellulatus]